jgi:hypothetical protein
MHGLADLRIDVSTLPLQLGSPYGQHRPGRLRPNVVPATGEVACSAQPGPRRLRAAEVLPGASHRGVT